MFGISSFDKKLFSKMHFCSCRPSGFFLMVKAARLSWILPNDGVNNCLTPKIIDYLEITG